MSTSKRNVWPTAGVDEEDAAALKEEEEIEVSTTRLNHRYAGNGACTRRTDNVHQAVLTSESHIHSLLNVLRYCNLEAGTKASRTPRCSVGNAAGGASFSSEPGSPDGAAKEDALSVLPLHF